MTPKGPEDPNKRRIISIDEKRKRWKEEAEQINRELAIAAAKLCGISLEFDDRGKRAYSDRDKNKIRIRRAKLLEEYLNEFVYGQDIMPEDLDKWLENNRADVNSFLTKRSLEITK